MVLRGLPYGRHGQTYELFQSNRHWLAHNCSNTIDWPRTAISDAPTAIGWPTTAVRSRGVTGQHPIRGMDVGCTCDDECRTDMGGMRDVYQADGTQKAYEMAAMWDGCGMWN